jgi:hypothetical protein
MKILLNLLFIFSFLFITGCQSDAISIENIAASTRDKLPTSVGDMSPTQPFEYNEGIDMLDPTINSDPQAQKMTQLAKESLSRKFKISEDQIHLSSLEVMTWPDSGLGCPQAGIVYAQVITPGFQILFEAMGQTFSYHTDNTERVILCDVRPPHEIFLPP